MCEVYEKIINERKEQIRTRYDMPCFEKFFFDNVELCSINNYYGIKQDNCFLLEPLYDEVRYLSYSIFYVYINDFVGLFDIAEAKWIIPLDRQMISTFSFSDYVEIKNESGCGLFSLESRSYLFKPEYEIITNQFWTEYFWAKKGESIDFLHRKSGRVVTIPNVKMAYDTPYGIYVKSKEGRVDYYNSDGCCDEYSLRKNVVKCNGRLDLCNYKLHCRNICNVYGIILL